MLLLWLPFSAGKFRAIRQDVTFEATETSYACFINRMHAKFLGEEGSANNMQDAKDKAEAFYKRMMGYTTEHVSTPTYVSHLERHETPVAGVNVIDSQYRMSRINDWRKAASTWTALLSRHINAPHPELKYYLNDPTYDWFADYQLDQNSLPSRPNGAI
jgi:hypothetical protein